jgi:hypothetical protein
MQERASAIERAAYHMPGRAAISDSEGLRLPICVSPFSCLERNNVDRNNKLTVRNDDPRTSPEILDTQIHRIRVLN